MTSFEETARQFPEETAEGMLVLQATHVISDALGEQGVTRAEFARRLKRTPGYVTQVLSGGRNMTLRTLALAALALGKEVRIELVDRKAA